VVPCENRQTDRQIDKEIQRNKQTCEVEHDDKVDVDSACKRLPRISSTEQHKIQYCRKICVCSTKCCSVPYFNSHTQLPWIEACAETADCSARAERCADCEFADADPQ